MKITIPQDSVNFEDLKSKLALRFPDYKIKTRTKNFGIVQKTATAGTNVILKRNKIYVTANFPTIGGTLIFMLAIIFLGVVIPIILYFSIFFAAQKKVEKEVGDFLAKEYGAQA